MAIHTILQSEPLTVAGPLVMWVRVVMVGVVALVASLSRQPLGAAVAAAGVRRARDGLRVALARCRRKTGYK